MLSRDLLCLYALEHEKTCLQSLHNVCTKSGPTILGAAHLLLIKNNPRSDTQFLKFDYD